MGSVIVPLAVDDLVVLRQRRSGTRLRTLAVPMRLRLSSWSMRTCRGRG
jgi:hypothetical protein